VSSDDWEACGLFDDRDRAAILWADRVTRNEAHADPDAWARVRAVFTEPQAVELTLVACLFNFLNRFNDTMWLELDDGAPANANLHVHPDAFDRYAAKIDSPHGR
jgi:alkylhydroperoxidase family enzyme